jgi:hypothetical protein
MMLLRMVLFFILGVSVWRIVRIATRMMQGPRSHNAEDPFATYTPSRKSPDLKDIQDADFEDITEKRPPPTPPSGQ